MEATAVKLIRDKLKAVKSKDGVPAPLIIICDNLKLFDEMYGGVTWDDANNILWVTRSKENWIQGNRGRCEFETTATTYDHIQYITLAHTTEALVDVLKDELGYSDEAVAELIKRFAPEQTQYLKSIMTKEQLEYLEKRNAEKAEFYAFDHSVKSDLKSFIE